MIADRVNQIGMSPTLRIAALAGELKRQGQDVLDFSAGQPDFPTPEGVKRAGVRAIENNRTRYTANKDFPDAAVSTSFLFSVEYWFRQYCKGVVVLWK